MRGLVEFPRTSSGIPRVEGSKESFSRQEIRELLQRFSVLLKYYGDIIDARSQTQTDPMLKDALKEKAKSIYLSALAINTSIRSDNQADQARLLLEHLYNLRKIGRNRSESDSELKQRVESLLTYMTTVTDQSKLEDLVIHTFTPPESYSELEGLSEKSIAKMLTAIRRYCTITGKSMNLDNADDEEYHAGYRILAKRITNLEVPGVPSSLLFEVAEELRRLEAPFKNNSFENKSPREIIEYLYKELTGTNSTN